MPLKWASANGGVGNERFGRVVEGASGWTSRQTAMPASGRPRAGGDVVDRALGGLGVRVGQQRVRRRGRAQDKDVGHGEAGVAVKRGDLDRREAAADQRRPSRRGWRVDEVDAQLATAQRMALERPRQRHDELAAVEQDDRDRQPASPRSPSVAPGQRRPRERCAAGLQVLAQREVLDVLALDREPLLERQLAAAVDLHRPGDTRPHERRKRRGLRVRRVSQNCSGRGPTRLMSPRRTLSSCGSSSMLERRRPRPTRVTRGSSASLKTARRGRRRRRRQPAAARRRRPSCELEHRERRPAAPARCWRKIDRPRVSQPDRDHRQQQPRQQQRQRQRRDDDVERALGRQRRAAHVPGPELDQRQLGEVASSTAVPSIARSGGATLSFTPTARQAVTTRSSVRPSRSSSARMTRRSVLAGRAPELVERSAPSTRGRAAAAQPAPGGARARASACEPAPRRGRQSRRPARARARPARARRAARARAARSPAPSAFPHISSACSAEIPSPRTRATSSAVAPAASVTQCRVGDSSSTVWWRSRTWSRSSSP